MTEDQGRRARRLRAVPSTTPRDTAPETAESVLPDLPRVGALDALLREVDNLRLTLETDLTLAASAVEAGAPQIAADIIDGDREGLRAFEERALGHVADLAAPKRRRLRVPAAPFVAAAAVAGFLLGVVPHTQPPSGDQSFAQSSLSTPSESLDRVQQAAAAGHTSAAINAAEQLHAQLAVIAAGSDPTAAARAIDMLYQERTALALTGNDSLAMKQLLADSQRLATILLKSLPPALAAKVAPTATLPPVAVVASPKPQPSSSPKPRQSASTKPAPTSSPKAASHPSSSSKPAPSSSPSPGGPGLPGAPDLH